MMFPNVWGGFGCFECRKDHSMVFVHLLCKDTWAIRQAKCATFEAPFLYLLKGETRALLIDTGDLAHDAELLAVLRKVVGELPLVLVHTHRESCCCCYVLCCF